MKVLVLIAVLVATAVQAADGDRWTCSYPLPVRPALLRFEVKSPHLIDIKSGDSYRLIEDNVFGLVAAQSIARPEQGRQQPTVGVSILIIDKSTGEFWFGGIVAGQSAAANQPAQGTCIKD